MAYIQPNSIIEFFGDINLSSNYENTLYFANEAAKDNYFSGLTKLGTVSNCTYTRENRGSVRVELPMSRLIGATYMRFKNTSFENKWFYAFVTKVDYVNNLTTEVQFQLDKIMTWMGTFTLNQCYIERQHTLNDGIGNNIAEEGLSIGEYIVEDSEEYTMGLSRIVLVYIENEATVSSGKIVGGVYSPYTVAVYRPDQIVALNNLLRELVRKDLIDNVVSMYMCYSDITNTIADDDGEGHDDISITKPYSSLNGYVPRNNKLFCYPYKYMEVDNREGDSHEYYYEFFNTLPDQTSIGTCDFRRYWVINAKCEVMMVPKNYKGVSGEFYDERIGMSHFPQCAFAINTYAAYLAQKNAYLAQTTAKAALVGAGAGIATNITGAQMTPQRQLTYGGRSGPMLPGEPSTPTIHYNASRLDDLPLMGINAAVGAGVGAAGAIANNLIERKIRPTAPSEARGDVSIDAMFANFQKNFVVIKRCITKNYAMMLDSYFDMFGYAVKQHGVPNMNARPNWTFVKTIGCSVGGNIPADDAKEIESIFDNGIRFWKNHNNIGNYSLNNAPE